MSEPKRYLYACLRLVVTLAAAILTIPATDSQGQEAGISFETLIPVESCDTLLSLPHRFIFRSSFVLKIDETKLLPGRDFSLEAGKGLIRLHIPDSVCAIPLSGVANIRYRYLPLAFRRAYLLRVPLALTDTATGVVDTIYRSAAEFTSEDFFGNRLQRSGSLIRGIEAGTNRDLTLNSGFRLQMSGELSEDLSLLAALTDENSPLQPEGTTETLQELDRIFIELRSPKATATLGDLSLGFSSGRFGRLNRKLRGGLASYSDSGGTAGGRVEAGGASVRGKYVRNELRGSDGVQGPYRLTGRNNEYPVIVIAGTEHVYLDGREMIRGQLNDYTIDYGLGEIIFTSGRRISFASRIVVEFEYLDRRYSRDLLGGQGRMETGGGRWSLNGMIVRENDDGDSPADVTLTEAERDILRSAGDSPGRAIRSGVDSVGPGKGKYELRDTLVYFPLEGFSRDTTILVFNPTDTIRALYLGSFSAVGRDSGDYEKISIGHYRYAGPGKGRYAPVRFLPLPEKHTFADVEVRGRLTDLLTLSGEYAASSHDRNSFSSLDDGDNAGGAYDLTLHYGRKDIAVSGAGPRTLGASLHQRKTTTGFVPLDRYNTVEFDRDWNAPITPGTGELLRELDVTLSPVGDLSLSGYAGGLKRGSAFSSERYGSGIALEKVGGYRFEFLRSDDAPAGGTTERIRHDAIGKISAGRVSPQLGFRSERTLVFRSGIAGVDPASYSFVEIAPAITLDSIAGMGISAGWTYRIDDSVRDASLVRASRSFFQTYGWKIESDGVSSTLDLLLGKRRFDAEYAHRRTDNTAQVRSLTRFAPWGRVVQGDLYYEVSPEHSARLERLFSQVPRGSGNYRHVGDLNANGILDEADFRLTRFDGDYILVSLPGEELIPVLNLKSSFRLRTDLSAVSTFLSPVSGETYIRIEEKSSDSAKSNVYLLRLQTFRSPATTLNGNMLFTQELNLWERETEFSLKLRFLQKRGFTRLTSGDEVVFSRERTVRIRWSAGKDLSNQAEFQELTDAVDAGFASGRTRAVRSRRVSLDWTYRPVDGIESGFGVGLGDAKNYDKSRASLNSQRISLVWSMRNNGRLRTEFSREEAVVSGDLLDIPYELTRGRSIGKTWIWSFNFEYRLTRFLESSMRYEGRKEQFFRTVHTAGVEVRAFF